MMLVSLIVPTLGNRNNLLRFLTSVKNQSFLPIEIILVDGSVNGIDEDIKNFKEVRLIYIRAAKTSLTQARNLGIKYICDTASFAAFLDDDIVLEANALLAMRNFWETCELKIGGCSFNITNTNLPKKSFLKKFFLLESEFPGQVLVSGFTTQHFPAQKNFKAQWLCGGATVWRREVFSHFLFDDAMPGYSFPDDLEFSYRVSKKYELWVNADARVLHLHQKRTMTVPQCLKLGMIYICGRRYFISKHKNISVTAFYWAHIGQIFIYLSKAILNLDYRMLIQSFGVILGFLRILKRRRSESWSNILLA